MRSSLFVRGPGTAIAAATVVVALGGSAAATSVPPEPGPATSFDLATLEALDPERAECPFDLAAAVLTTGADPVSAIDFEVEHASETPPESSTPVGDAAALDRARGVFVDCRVEVEGAAATALLHATPLAHGSDAILLPVLVYRGQIDGDDMEGVYEDIASTRDGELIGLDSVSNGTVAAAPIAIDGAADATLMVHADDLDETSDGDDTVAEVQPSA